MTEPSGLSMLYEIILFFQDMTTEASVLHLLLLLSYLPPSWLCGNYTSQDRLGRTENIHTGC